MTTNSEKSILYPAVQSERGSPSNHADYLFWCPGCKEAHGVWTTKRNGVGATWAFNGDMERPTFTPSILVRWFKNPPEDPKTGDFAKGPDGKYITGPDGKLAGGREMVCHSFVRDGQIQYLPDCTHEFAGKTIPMEPF